MIIREMTEEDLDQVVDIERSCFSQPWSKDGFLNSMKSGDVLFLVAEAEKSDLEKTDKTFIMGYIGMIMSVDEGEITNVATNCDFRRRGSGEALLKAAMEKARENLLSRIVLEVRVSNAPAIGLYEKLGFTSLGIRKNFYDFPKEDAYIMVWEDLC